MGVRLPRWASERTGWTSVRRRLIPVAGQARLLDPALTAEYANPAKRPGRGPGDRLWVRVPPRLLVTAGCQRSAVKTGRVPVPIVACRRLTSRSTNGPVFQRRESQAHILGAMVRLHPGPFSGLQVLRRHASVVERKTGFESRADLDDYCGGACTRGARLARNQFVMGSIPIVSIRQPGPIVQREDASSADWKPGFNPR